MPCVASIGAVEVTTYAGVAILGIVVQSLIIFGLIWWLRSQIEEIVDELDSNLAGAIQKVVTELPLSDIEPPNPFQMFLMDMMRQKTTPGEIEVIPRDTMGKFT